MSEAEAFRRRCLIIAAVALAVTMLLARWAWSVPPPPATVVDTDIETMFEHAHLPTRKTAGQYALGKALAAGVPCHTGYAPAAYAGKPDPWPNNVPLPNLALLNAFIGRYNQTPGFPSAMPNDETRAAYEAAYGQTNWASLVGKTISGYCCELSGNNDTALGNASTHGGQGPYGEPLSPSCASTTESTDLQYQARRGDNYYGAWVVAFMQGGTAANPAHISDRTKPCGVLPPIPHAIWRDYTLYEVNDPPCGETPPPTPTPTPVPTPVPTPTLQPTATPCPTVPPCPPAPQCSPPPSDAMVALDKVLSGAWKYISKNRRARLAPLQPSTGRLLQCVSP
jgi:hypothetical protein